MAEPKKSVQEFAQAIKAKYPQYKDIDDYTLAKKVVAKYPQYADAVDFDEKKKASGEPSEEFASAPQSTLPKTLAETRPSVAPIEEVEQVDEFAKTVVDRKAEAKKANFETSGSIATPRAPAAGPVLQANTVAALNQYAKENKDKKFTPQETEVLERAFKNSAELIDKELRDARMEPFREERVKRFQNTFDNTFGIGVPVYAGASLIRPYVSDDVKDMIDDVRTAYRRNIGLTEESDNRTWLDDFKQGTYGDGAKKLGLDVADAVGMSAAIAATATPQPGMLTASAPAASSLGRMVYENIKKNVQANPIGAVSMAVQGALDKAEELEDNVYMTDAQKTAAITAAGATSVLTESLFSTGDQIIEPYKGVAKNTFKEVLKDWGKASLKAGGEESLESNIEIVGNALTDAAISGTLPQVNPDDLIMATVTSFIAPQLNIAQSYSPAALSTGLQAMRGPTAKQENIETFNNEVQNLKKIKRELKRTDLPEAERKALQAAKSRHENNIKAARNEFIQLTETFSDDDKNEVINIMNRIGHLDDEFKKTKSQVLRDEMAAEAADLLSRKAAIEDKYKQQADAVQEQAAGQVPVQPEAEAGGEVAQGEPQAEPQIATQEGLTEEVQVETSAADVTIESPFDEFGEPDYDAEDAVREIAKQRDLGITSDRELATVARDANGNVIGGAFTSYDNNTGEYTFDVVVSEDAEGRGVGSKLLDAVKDLPGDVKDMNPDAKVKVDVVNPNMQKMLEKRGFVVTEKTGEDRVTMEPSSQVKEQKPAKLTTKKAPAPKVEKTQEELDLETQEQQLRALEDDIQIEKDNFVERKAEIAEQIKEAKANKELSAPERRELIEDLKAELKDAKNESNAIIEQYKEDAKALKKDIGKAKTKLQKKVQQAAPKAVVEPVAPAATTSPVSLTAKELLFLSDDNPRSSKTIFSNILNKILYSDKFKSDRSRLAFVRKYVDPGFTYSVENKNVPMSERLGYLLSDEAFDISKDDYQAFERAVSNLGIDIDSVANDVTASLVESGGLGDYVDRVTAKKVASQQKAPAATVDTTIEAPAVQPFIRPGVYSPAYIKTKLAEAYKKLPTKKFVELFNKHVDSGLTADIAKTSIGRDGYVNLFNSDDYVKFFKDAGVELAKEEAPVAMTAEPTTSRKTEEEKLREARRALLLKSGINPDVLNRRRMADGTPTFKKLQKIAETARKAVAKVMPDLKIVVYNDVAEYSRATGDAEHGQYNPSTKTIHINGTRATPSTIAHEVFHAVFLNKVKNDPTAQRIASTMIESIKRIVGKDSEIYNFLEDFSSQYKENFRDEEKLAELVAILSDFYAGNRTYGLSEKAIQSFKNAIKKFIQDFADAFGIDLQTKLDDAQVMAMLNTIARKTISGKEITNEDLAIIDKLVDTPVGEQVRKDVRKRKGLITLTEKDVIKYSKIGVVDQRMAQAMESIGLSGVKFTEAGVKEAVSKKFNDVIQEYLTNETYEGEIPFIHKGSQALKEAIINDAEAAYRRGSIKVAERDNYVKNAGEESLQNEYIKKYADTQKREIGRWIKYLEQSSYDDAFKYMIFDAVLTFNYDLNTGQYKKRTADTLRGITTFDSGILATLYRTYSKELLKDYVRFMYYNAFNVVEAHKYQKTDKGIWVKFQGIDNPDINEEASALSQLVQDTPWCTKELAHDQLTDGDFYVFVTGEDKPSPRIAVRMEGTEVAEARGIENGSRQDIESDMLDIAEKFLTEEVNGEEYLKELEESREFEKIKEANLTITEKTIDDLARLASKNGRLSSRVTDFIKQRIKSGNVSDELKDSFYFTDDDNVPTSKTRYIVSNDDSIDTIISYDKYTRYGNADVSNVEYVFGALNLDMRYHYEREKVLDYINNELGEFSKLTAVYGNLHLYNVDLKAPLLKNVTGNILVTTNRDVLNIEKLSFPSIEVAGSVNVNVEQKASNFIPVSFPSLKYAGKLGISQAGFESLSLEECGEITIFKRDDLEDTLSFPSLKKVGDINGYYGNGASIKDLSSLVTAGTISVSPGVNLDSLESVNFLEVVYPRGFNSDVELIEFKSNAFYKETDKEKRELLKKDIYELLNNNNFVISFPSLKSAGTIQANQSLITSLGSLKEVGNLRAGYIESLGDLEYVSGDLSIRLLTGGSLGNLKTVDRVMSVDGIEALTEPSKLQSVFYMYFRGPNYKNIVPFPDLKTIGGFASAPSFRPGQGSELFPALKELGLARFDTELVGGVFQSQLINPKEESSVEREIKDIRDFYIYEANAKGIEFLEDIAGKTFDAQVELIRTGIELNTQAPRQRKADGKAPLKQRIEEIRKAAEAKRNERMAAREKGMSEAARKFKAEQEAKAKLKQEAKEQKAKIQTAMDGYINAIIESGDAKTIAAAFKNFQEVAGKLDKTEFVQQLRRTIAKLKEDKHISTVSAGNLNRILRTIERVSPATYALEVDRAMNAVKKEINTQLRKQLNTNRKKALKNIQSGRIGNSTIKPLFQRVLSIDASMIPDESFDDYIAIVTRLGAKQAVLPLADRRAMETTLNNILDNVDAEAGRLIELGEMYNDFVSSNNLGEEAYSKVLDKMKSEGLITEKEKEMMKRYKSIILSEAKIASAGKRAENPETRAALEEELSNIDINVKALENRDDRAIATAIQDNLDAASEMTSQDIRKLLLVVDNINKGFLPHMGEVVRRKLVSINDGKKLASALNKVSLPLGEKIIVNVKGALMRLMGRKATETGTVRLAAERNPAAFIDEVFGNFKTTPIYDTLIRPMASAFSSFQRDFDVAVNKLNTAEDKLYKSKKTDNEFRSAMYKIQMYLIQREYETNVGNPEVRPAVEWIKATIDAIEEGKLYNEATAAELREQLTKFSEDGQVSTEKIEKSLTPAEKGLIKAIDEVNNSIKDKAVHVSDVIRGEGIEARDNYVHIQVFNDGNNNPLKEIDAFTERYTASTKAKSLITRTGKVNPINLDPYQTAVRGLKMTLLDYHMTPAIKQVNGTLAASKDMVTQRQNLTAVESLMQGFNEGVLANAVGSSMSPDITDTLVTNGYRAVLASVRRAIAETASNISFAISNPAQFTAGVKSYYKLDSDVSFGDVMRNSNSVHTTRLAGGETLTSPQVEKSGFRNTGGVKTEMQPDVINKMARISKLGRRYTKSVGALADLLMSTPDAMVSRPIWLGAYENTFKELTGKEPDLKKISDNDEAYMEANRDAIKKASKEADKQVTQAAASNNPYETIAKLRVNEKDASSKKIYKAVNGFISRFAIFEYNTARRAIYAMIGNGSISRKEGAALLTGVAMRSIVYVMASGYIGGVMSALAQSALANLGWAGLEEEEEEDDLMEAILPNADTLPKLYRSIGGAIANIFINRNFGNVIKNINGLLVETANEEYGQFLRNGQDYDPYENNILMNQLSSLMTPGNSNEKIANFVAAFAGPLSPVARTFISTFNLTNRALNNKTAASRKENLDKLKIRVPLEFAGNLGLIPVYNDVRKATMDVLYDDIKKEEAFRQEVKRLINQYPNGGEKFEREIDKTFSKYTRFKTRQAINKQKELLEDN